METMGGKIKYKQFGVKKTANYFDRLGAYIVPIKDGKIAVVSLPRGLFLLGGGVEEGETEEQCIVRECFEEIGYSIKLGTKFGWSETYTVHSKLGYFHPIQHYYYAELVEKTCEPTEENHTLCWIPFDEVRGKMFSEMQNWAVNQAITGASR